MNEPLKPDTSAATPAPLHAEGTSKKEKKNKGDRADKGIETMLKITATNSQRLSDQADSKAHILITVNSIIISVLLGTVARKLDTDSNLTIPTLLLLTVSLVTIVFSILATRPHVAGGTFRQQDAAAGRVNLLFFGNLYRTLSKHWRANAGLTGQFYHNLPSNNEGRFITDYARQNPNKEIFASKFYAGLVGELNFDTREQSLLPTHGVHWNTQLTASQQLDGLHDTYGQVTTNFSFNWSPGNSSRLTIANRLGGGTTVGTPAFFQQLYLGGNLNLRGYRNFRFAGESPGYYNLEVRLKLLDFTSYLFPGTLGLIGFNDTGRVWAKGESSNTWHNGAGAGFYLVPAKLLLIQGLVAFSKEDTLPYFSVGFRF